LYPDRVRARRSSTGPQNETEEGGTPGFLLSFHPSCSPFESNIAIMDQQPKTNTGTNVKVISTKAKAVALVSTNDGFSLQVPQSASETRTISAVLRRSFQFIRMPLFFQRYASTDSSDPWNTSRGLRRPVTTQDSARLDYKSPSPALPKSL
jgi:hypothetical protein